MGEARFDRIGLSLDYPTVLTERRVVVTAVVCHVERVGRGAVGLIIVSLLFQLRRGVVGHAVHEGIGRSCRPSDLAIAGDIDSCECATTNGVALALGHRVNKDGIRAFDVRVSVLPGPRILRGSLYGDRFGIGAAVVGRLGSEFRTL